MDVTQTALSSSCCSDILEVMDCKLELGAEMNPFFPKRLCAWVFYHSNRNETEKISKALGTWCLAVFWKVTLTDIPHEWYTTVESLALSMSLWVMGKTVESFSGVFDLLWNNPRHIKRLHQSPSVLCYTILVTPDIAMRSISNSYQMHCARKHTPHPTSLVGSTWKTSYFPANSGPHQICVSLAPSLFCLTCL